MDKYRPHGVATVIKTDKKDLLLSGKDPSFTHLFEPNNPSTPNTVSAETLASGNIDVDSNYPEESTEQDYALFSDQSTTFMQDIKLFPTTQNQCLPSNVKKNDYSQQLASSGLLTISTNAKHHETTDEKSHLLSPPPDNYNMQLLAYSAQQQQRLQQQQQHGIYNQGNSSAVALQQLARIHHQKEHELEYSDGQPSYNTKASAYPLLTRTGDIKNEGPSKTIHNPSNINSNFLPTQSRLGQNNNKPQATSAAGYSWNFAGRATPDLERGHIRDLSFGSQDSPLIQVQPSDIIKPNSKLHFNKISAQSIASSSNVPEPELKSPLDHPEQLEQHRNRFFSNESTPASGGQQQNTDAHLNEHDKKAVAAIGKLMEMSEKMPSASANSMSMQVKPFEVSVQMPSVNINNRGTPIPLNVFQMQEIFRNTPPPPYEPAIFSAAALPLQSALIATSGVTIAGNSNIKQEPTSPSKSSRHVFVPESNHYRSVQNNLPAGLPDQQVKFIPGPDTGIPIGNTALYLGNTSIGTNLLASNSYRSISHTPNTVIVSEKPNPALPAKVPTSRSRRSSSSGSTRRKSEGGGLTCSICGHSFKSIPALNGHMRVHSTPEKKQSKEERLSRTASHDSAAKASPVSKTSISPQSQPFFDGAKLQPPMHIHQQNQTLNSDNGVQMLPYQLAQDGETAGNRPHNGLLTMASAACFLKTEASKADYIHGNTVIPSAYIVPPTMFFPQPTVVPNSYSVDVLNSNYTENHPAGPKLEQSQVSEGQNINYSQVYAAPPFQQGLTYPSISFFANVPQVTQTAVHQSGEYPSNQQPQMQVLPNAERDNMTVNSQEFVNQHEKPIGLVAGVENYSRQYEPVQNETNSLCQLASIAVAAAGREYVPEIEMQSNMSATYQQNDLQAGDSGVSNVAIMQGQINTGQTQEDVFQPSGMTAEASPLQSGNDPFIFPVDHRQNQQRSHYEDFNSNSIGGSTSINRESMVTWKDNVDTRSYPMLSSYDDPLMQEAVNVANPSKILPNSMMGGTPSNSILSGARPFRQRHHSEGAHLIKKPETNILKDILDNPAVSDRPTTNENLAVGNTAFHSHQASIHQTSNAFSNNSIDNAIGPGTSNPGETKKEEFWAEPKPVRRIRRRRHSADSRLALKPGLPVTARPFHQAGNPNKKTAFRQDRARRRPPPLVIPSSVSTFSNPHNLYQSHLHHRRRPSGESMSSANGLNDKIPPYTPPPMLSPIRAGTGLYCTTPVTPILHRQKSSDGGFSTILEVDECDEDEEELIRSSEPKINIGYRFQAVISPKCIRKDPSMDVHKADMVWNGKKVCQSNSVFKHIEQFMDLSCSAVAPYGGSNKELALDCIAQSKGDILDAVRRLITRKHDKSLENKPIKDYTGSGRPWTQEEIRLFDCAMLEHRKDFFIISRMVKTRTTFECVERYYHVVKRNRRRHRLPRRYRDQENDDFSLLLADSLEGKNLTPSNSGTSSEDEQTVRRAKVSSDTDLGWNPYSDSQSKSEVALPFSSQSSVALESRHNLSKPLKTHAARVQQGHLDASSPVGSPVSTVSNDDQQSQVFSCPVCGKSFGKVKSRNAHMKTHGKQAQEKRRQREEEAARRASEANRQLAAQQRSIHPPVHHSNFIHPPPANIFPHPQHHVLQQGRPDCVVPRFSGGM